ncbi:VanW family protein [Paenibacillus sp. CMAA1364]
MIFILGTTLIGCLYLYSQQDTLPKGTTVSGWDVGGLSSHVALQEVDNKMNQLKKLPINYTLNHPSKFVIHAKSTLGESGVDYDADDFRNAVIQLREGNMFQRAYYRWNFNRSYVITPHWTSYAMQHTYSEAWENDQFGVPINAIRSINARDQVVYTAGITSYRLDWDAIANRMISIIPKDFTPLEDDVTAPFLYELPLVISHPKISMDDLKKEGIDRKFIEFSTVLGSSGEGRVYNVNSAAQATNGILLRPGETFDFGKVIAFAEKQYGFREAPVIINGRLVPGVGGGICQVSSTLYNAAIRTGLDIVERRSHSLPVSYLPKGQDATFATGSINFRFKNNTGKHLLILAAVHQRTLTIKFFGTFPTNIHYDIESIIVETLTPANKYVNNATLPLGTQEVLQQGNIGYVVDTYQIKKVDGVIKDRKRISRDTYQPQKRIIGIHPEEKLNMDPPIVPKEKPIIEDGVSGPNF